MFQNAMNEKLASAQAKSLESAQAIAQLAVESAQAIAEIQYEAAKDSVAIAQAKVAKVLTLKDPKEVLEMLKGEDAQAALAEVNAIHSKVSEVLRKGKKEVVEMIESAMGESRSELKKMIKEATAKAPAGSEAVVSAFNSMLENTLQSFDQAYSASKDAYANFEKSIDSTMSSFQGQSAKPAPKSRKAIAA